jgi:Fe-S cluster assembly protein SufD
MSVTPLKKEDTPVEETVQKPAPSAERKPFAVVEKRYSPETAENILAESDAYLNERKKSDEAWLIALRESSLAHLKERGLPTPRLERWKYSRAAGLDKVLTGLKMTGERDESLSEADLPQDLSPLRLIFVNGYYSEALSNMPDGLEICGNAADFQKETLVKDLWNNAPVEAFNDQMQWALNSLYSTGGAIVNVPKNMIMEQAIDIVYLTTKPYHFMPRTLISVGDNANVTITERFIDKTPGGLPQAINAVESIIIGQNARLTHHKFNEYGAEDMVLSTVHVRQARDSFYAAYNVGAGLEKVVREQIWVQLQGENAETFLNGVQLSKGSQDHETVITMTHEAPNCQSNQDYRHIAADMASCHFSGKVHVHQIAQKTDAYQMSRGVVLSERAQVNTKPELEIYADDVKCSHGATTGQIDEEALFYMRSRGLSEADAYSMLLTSFSADVFEALGEDDAYAAKHIETITRWLKDIDE